MLFFKKKTPEEKEAARLEKLRSMRSQEKVDQCLNAITKSMETGEGNLL